MNRAEVSQSPETGTKPLERIVFCSVSDEAITRKAARFLSEFSKPDYNLRWNKEFGSEGALVEEAFETEGPIVWYHWKDYLVEQKRDGFEANKEIIDAAVTHETRHVARAAVELYPLTVSQMTLYSVRPEMTNHDLKEMQRAQTALHVHPYNIRRSMILAERVRSSQG